MFEYTFYRAEKRYSKYHSDARREGTTELYGIALRLPEGADAQQFLETVVTGFKLNDTEYEQWCGFVVTSEMILLTQHLTYTLDNMLKMYPHTGCASFGLIRRGKIIGVISPMDKLDQKCMRIERLNHCDGCESTLANCLYRCALTRDNPGYIPEISDEEMHILHTQHAAAENRVTHDSFAAFAEVLRSWNSPAKWKFHSVASVNGRKEERFFNSQLPPRLSDIAWDIANEFVIERKGTAARGRETYLARQQCKRECMFYKYCHLQKWGHTVKQCLSNPSAPYPKEAVARALDMEIANIEELTGYTKKDLVTIAHIGGTEVQLEDGRQGTIAGIVMQSGKLRVMIVNRRGHSIQAVTPERALALACLPYRKKSGRWSTHDLYFDHGRDDYTEALHIYLVLCLNRTLATRGGWGRRINPRIRGASMNSHTAVELWSTPNHWYTIRSLAELVAHLDERTPPDAFLKVVGNDAYEKALRETADVVESRLLVEAESRVRWEKKCPLDYAPKAKVAQETAVQLSMPGI